ncbi:MAG: ABC transporter permease subunit, partial [Butyrivibrio sp.]|nr:ABC transporter permease subunit [Butyrivibrio sp.]
MKKTVIGLNLKYIYYAFGASVLTFLSIFLPFISRDDLKTNMLSLSLDVLGKENASGLKFVLVMAVVVSVIGLLMGIVSIIKTSKALVFAWQCVLVLETALFTLGMFVTKTVTESAGLVSSFLNKDLSVGYFLGIVSAYAGLILVMKTTKTNIGYIALTILGIIWLFPVLWIVLTALRAEQGYYVGYFFPKKLTLDNFISLFRNDSVIPFAKWWLNTFIVAMCGCVINTLIVLSVSFVLSRTRFAGRKVFMNVLMIIGMFPGFMSLIAVYNILKGIGLNQSLLALIVVGAAGAAMGYHVSKGFFDTIPKAIDEAAIIDGASRLQIFTRITLPLSKSIIVYTVLGSFLGAWSDYIFP